MNEIASDEDHLSLRDSVGFTLNAIAHETRRARKGCDRLRRRTHRRCVNGR